MARLLYMIIFYLIYGVTDLALLVIALIQVILKIFTGEPSETLKDSGRSLALYVKQIAEYLSYASERKPFPFSDWPVVESVESEEEWQEMK